LSPNSFVLRAQTIMSGAPKNHRHRAAQPHQRPSDASSLAGYWKRRARQTRIRYRGNSPRAADIGNAGRYHAPH